METQERFYNDIITALSDIVDNSTLQKFSRQLPGIIGRYEITPKCTDLAVVEQIPNCVKSYLVTRKIEGLSDNSLNLYKLRLTQFFKSVQKPIDKITTNDIRLYLYCVQEETHCTDRTLDGTRTVISTFFRWANAEGYIQSNPCLTVKPIKYAKKDRGYLSELEMEMLRNACDNLRDSAIVETFYSTGCRVSELIGIKISDIDFTKNEVTLFGKGSKYRKSYLNIRAKLAIQKYLDSRTDNGEYLFVSRRKPYGGLTKDAVEAVIRELGKTAKINRSVFPHLIRHTTATLALQRGMDITEIQRMLGHEKIETTLIYAAVADEAVKSNHKKYVV